MSKPGKSLRNLCKRLKVRVTVKRGKKRVYKSIKVLKAQCKRKAGKKKRRRRKFGTKRKRDEEKEEAVAALLSLNPNVEEKAFVKANSEDNNGRKLGLKIPNYNSPSGTTTLTQNFIPIIEWVPPNESIHLSFIPDWTMVMMVKGKVIVGYYGKMPGRWRRIENSNSINFFKKMTHKLWKNNTFINVGSF